LAAQSAGGQRLTQTGLSLGTPQYMSPEQAMGERTIDARSDICALGAVTYEMLVGGAALLATGSAVWLGTREAPTPVSARFDVALPGSVELYAVSGRRLALSVDGTKVLVVATKGGKVSLYLREWTRPSFDWSRAPSSQHWGETSIPRSLPMASRSSSARPMICSGFRSRAGNPNASIPRARRAGLMGGASCSLGPIPCGRSR